MAFGFSKQWVIKHGGQPVTYFNHIQKGLFLKNALALHDFLLGLKDIGPCLDGLKMREIASALQRLRYVLHFMKPFAQSKDRGTSARKRPEAPITPRPPVTRRRVVHRPATRHYGQVLDYLEEREWRIVRHGKPYFVNDPTGRFDSRLRFELGAELFSLVLPDNELVKMAWNDKFLRNRFLNAKVPITVLSFQDIGTF